MTKISLWGRGGIAAVALALISVGCGSDESPGAETAASLVDGVASSTTPPTAAPTTVPVPTAPPTTNTVPTIYIVLAGDSLYGIADKHCVDIDLLLYANGFPEGIDHVLQPDDKIVIPPTACRNGGAGVVEPAGTKAPATTAAPTTSA